MSGLKNTKRRILSVKNTQKITRAMKLVSSAKFARTFQSLGKAKFFSKALDKILVNLAPSFEQFKDQLPLLERREENKTLVVVISSDRGLCGALNTNLLKFSQNFIDEKTKKKISTELILWGRKSHFLKKRRAESVISTAQKISDKPDYFFCKKEVQGFINGFKEGRWDRVYLVYPEFQNVISQRPNVVELLPLAVPAYKAEQVNWNMLVEPPTVQFIEEIMETKLADLLFQMLIEGSASEHAARMAAMDSATTNADKVIKDLTLEYNRARQAAITKELIEITSGAEAL